MEHHTELSFVDEFRWVSPLHYKKRMTERFSSLVHVASGAAIFTLLLRRRVAFLHRTATCRPLFKPSVCITFVNFRDNRAVFRIFIVLLRFSFDSFVHIYIYICVCVFVCVCVMCVCVCVCWPRVSDMVFTVLKIYIKGWILAPCFLVGGQ